MEGEEGKAVVSPSPVQQGEGTAEGNPCVSAGPEDQACSSGGDVQ